MHRRLLLILGLAFACSALFGLGRVHPASSNTKEKTRWQSLQKKWTGNTSVIYDAKSSNRTPYFPVLACSPKGNYHAFFGIRDNLIGQHRISTNRGKTWKNIDGWDEYWVRSTIMYNGKLLALLSQINSHKIAIAQIDPESGKHLQLAKLSIPSDLNKNIQSCGFSAGKKRIYIWIATRYPAEIVVFRSTDDGSTWSKPGVIDTESLYLYSSFPPVALFIIKDQAHLLYCRRQDPKHPVQHLVYDDESKAWKEDEFPAFGTDSVFGIFASTHKKKVYVLIARNVRYPKGKLQLYASTDRGKTWQDPVTISEEILISHSQNLKFSVLPNALTTHYSVEVFLGSEKKTELELMTSQDQGKTWHKNTLHKNIKQQMNYPWYNLNESGRQAILSTAQGKSSSRFAQLTFHSTRK